MKKLVKYLIINIRNFWNDIAAVQEEKSIKYNDLIKSATMLSIELNNYDNYTNTNFEKNNIAICASNSIEWIIAFLGSIFNNSTIILIPSLQSHSRISHILSVSNCNILITDLKDEEIKSLKFRGIVIPTKYLRSYNTEQTLIPKEVKDKISIRQIYRMIIKNFQMKRIGPDIIIYSPNDLKKIKISFSEILILLKELKNKEIFESKTEYLSYPTFTYNYVIGLLLPLISNTRIIINSSIISHYNIQYNIEKYKPPVIILNAYRFLQLYFNFVKSEPFKTKEYLRSLWKFLYYFPFTQKNIPSINNLIIKERLSILFPNIEKLIILNSSIGLYMEKLLKKINFPYTVTYGTVETCGIATYSDPSNFKLESVGKSITGNVTVIDNIIILHRILIKFNTPLDISLDDLGIKDKDGNIYFICRTSDYNTQSKRIEEVLRHIPFISECVLYKSLIPNENPYLLINIDYDQVENAELTDSREVLDIINNFIKKLSIPISKVIIWKSEFPRDSYERIQKF
jgi:hypothetical protein